MEENNIEQRLVKCGIRPTATRMLIYKHILEQNNTFSLGDIENAMMTIDKSTIFRTLILFKEHHLIHAIEDESVAIKYCLCRNQGECEEVEYHCHFYCEKCRKTFCLDYTLVTPIALPDGFKMRQIDYVVKGICKDCSKK